MNLTQCWQNNLTYKQECLKTYAARKRQLTANQQKIFSIYLDELSIHKAEYNHYYNEQRHPLLKHWNQIMPEYLDKPPSHYFSEDETIVLQTLLGKEKAALFYLALDNLTCYPYQKGWYRRTMRSRKWHLHLEQVCAAFLNFMIYSNTSLTPMQMLSLKRKDIDKDTVPFGDYVYCKHNNTYTLLAEIENNNQDLINYIEDIILSDNNTAAISYELINAIVKSHNAHLHKLLGDLLLAARLQEGLRQAITENMDNGTPEAFLSLLTVIEDNNLIRFSSIKRAFATWTSLIDSDNADKITRKELSCFRLYLSDETVRRQTLTSQNPVEIYLALWAYAFYEVDSTAPFIAELMQHGAKHQKLAAAYFLNATSHSELMLKLRIELLQKELLTDNDCQLLAALFHQSIQHINQFIINKINPSTLKNYYYGLKKLIPNLPKEKVYSPCIFPWHTEILYRSVLIAEMANIALHLNTVELANDFCDELPLLESYSRGTYLKKFHEKNPTNPKLRQLILKSLCDRSEYARSKAAEILKTAVLTADEYTAITDMLRYKYSDLRQNILKLLLKQTDLALAKTLKTLLSAKNENIRRAGLDILLQLSKKTDKAAYFQKVRTYTSFIAKPKPEEKILLAQIDGTDKTNSAKDNSANTKNCVPDLPLPTIDFKQYYPEIYCLSTDELLDLVDKLHKFYQEHANLAYKPVYGDEKLLGNCFSRTAYFNEEIDSLHAYPYPELWQKFYHEQIKNEQNLYLLHIFISLYRTTSQFKQQLYKIFAPSSCLQITADVRDKLKEYKYIHEIATIIAILTDFYVSKQYKFKTAILFALRHLQRFNLESLMRKNKYNQVTYLFNEYRYSSELYMESLCIPLRSNYSNEEEFKIAFSLLYTLWKKYDYRIYFSPYLLIRAAKLKLIDEDYIYAVVLDYNTLHRSDYLHELSMLYSKNKQLAQQIYTLPLNTSERSAKYTIDQDLFDYSLAITEKIIAHILSVELKRGDLPTKYTFNINKISHIFGINYFVDILVALGKDKLKNTSYFYSSGRRDTLSYLLSICQPHKDDTAKDLQKALKQQNISTSRLVEAVMLSPSWIPLVADVLKWKGFVSGCYYFQAHMRDADKKLASIFAKYTPISLEDLRDGAFDAVWFKECYKQLGKEHFGVLYAAAKYISSSNAHSRARKFADAVNNHLDADELQAQISDKRNKESLMAYGLIPLSKSGKLTKAAQKALLKRYIFIQEFATESKQFGAQRRASESLAVRIALENLARTAHFTDSLRLTLNMESRLIQDKNALFKPYAIDDLNLYLSIDELGTTSLICEKMTSAGEYKNLKSVPAKLKKHPHYLLLKQTKKEFTDQYRRSRAMFEQSMKDASTFFASEIKALFSNPIIKPLLQNLVFIHENAAGYFDAETLSLISPEAKSAITALTNSMSLRIAHPVDLYKLQVWHIYQKDLFDRQIKQPFKQIFRELYLKTPEELGKTETRRYDGNQIQPQKTYALLKNQGWKADYYDGLQKIYYQENIIATIYAMADWFSPADIEAPTLEYVSFCDRKTYRGINIADIPDIIFSEVMRDVDLVVSVAHVGGVDPEASHSTIEMRRAIVEFTLPLFKLRNVTFNAQSKNFAHIKGKLADYNIHLGSGVIHQTAGAQISVLPVHSQHRGRLFLPFVDDDPKTAEVLTKILFFAEDDKIKDPFILNQIKATK